MQLTGIHHLTAISADAPGNKRFYTGTMGMRMVKKTVNQDDTSAYHLFYADALARPGTDLTFFDWPAPPESRGTHSIARTGLRIAGPESFQWWNDGDAALVRSIWCLTRHLKPRKIVETGVAHGVTSRFILEALKRNGDGHLWSIDLPPLERFWRSQVGAAVDDRHSDRWSYIKGSSRRRLPKLLSHLGQIDLFVHDSLHSERNVRFELDRAWAALGPKGALVVDDVDANWGFRSFTQTFSGYRSLICQAEPLHPDLRRFNQKGLFGIILKQPTAQT